MGMMSLNKQPFDLPVNSVKKETSIADKVIVNSHDGKKVPTFWDYNINRKVHTKSTKIKFYVVGYRDISNKFINLVGRWVELEPYEVDFFYPIIPSTFPKSYRIGYYPYVEEQSGTLVARLQLIPYPSSNIQSELYIEKVTIMDSDFDSELSWFNDKTIPPITPPVDPPTPPPDPFGADPDPNCVWIYEY